MPPPAGTAPQPFMRPPVQPQPVVPIQRPRQTRTPLTISCVSPLVITPPPDSAPSKSSPDAGKSTAPPLDMLAEIDRLIHTQSAKAAPLPVTTDN